MDSIALRGMGSMVADVVFADESASYREVTSWSEVGTSADVIVAPRPGCPKRNAKRQGGVVEIPLKRCKVLGAHFGQDRRIHPVRSNDPQGRSNKTSGAGFLVYDRGNRASVVNVRDRTVHAFGDGSDAFIAQSGPVLIGPERRPE